MGLGEMGLGELGLGEMGLGEMGQNDPGTTQLFSAPPTISGTGRATNFKFCEHIDRSPQNKTPLKISGKVVVGVLSDSRNFSGHPYNRAHCAVIFATARLSCQLCRHCREAFCLQQFGRLIYACAIINTTYLVHVFLLSISMGEMFERKTI